MVVLRGCGTDASHRYSGGEIVKGNIVATVDKSGGLDMRYQHVNTTGALMVWHAWMSSAHYLATSQCCFEHGMLRSWQL